MEAVHSRGKGYQIVQKYGEINLKTDKEIYHPGDTVSGIISLNLFSSYPGNTLYLKIKCNEYTVSYENQHEKESLLIKPKLQKLCHFHYKFSIYQWPTIKEGQYEVPFSFILPLNIPNSYFEATPSFIGDITYHVEAFIETFMPNQPKLKYKHRFVVCNKASGPKSIEKNVILKTCCLCCFCKNGSNTLTVRFEKDFYYPEDTVKVMIRLDNTLSKLNCSGIEITLKQSIKLNQDGKEKTNSFTILKRNLSEVRAGQSSDDYFSEFKLPKASEFDFWVLKENFEDYFKRSSISSKNFYISSTSSGKFIKSEFYFEIKCQMEGYQSQVIDLRAPLNIYRNKYKNSDFNPAEHWKPEKLSNNILTLAPQFLKIKSYVNYKFTRETNYNKILLKENERRYFSEYQPAEENLELGIRKKKVDKQFSLNEDNSGYSNKTGFDPSGDDSLLSVDMTTSTYFIKEK